MKVIVGKWIETESREVTAHSEYAADYDNLRAIPGEYDLIVEFMGGYVEPMPKWALAIIPSVRVEGRIYSGVAGLNHAVRELPVGEAVNYGVQTYAYTIPRRIEDGTIRLNPAFAWLSAENAWEHEDAPRTWDDLRAMAAA